MAETVTPPNRDGRLLHFLKELPGWCVVSMALVFFTVMYLNTRDDFIPRIIDALIGAFLGLVVSQRPKPNTNIQADSVNPESMDNATVNTDSFNKPKGDSNV